jgi:hypothetical protein
MAQQVVANFRYKWVCGLDDPEGGVDDPGGGVVPLVPCGGVCGFIAGGVLAPFGGVAAPGVVPGGGVTPGFVAIPAPGPPLDGGAPGGGIFEPGGVIPGGNPGRPPGVPGSFVPGPGVGLVSLWLINSTSNISSDFAGIGPFPVSPYANS